MRECYKKCSLFIKINLCYEPEWNKQSCGRREQLGWPPPQVGNSQPRWHHTLSPQQDPLSSPSQRHGVLWALGVVRQPSLWINKALLVPLLSSPPLWQKNQEPHFSESRPARVFPCKRSADMWMSEGDLGRTMLNQSRHAPPERVSTTSL